MRNNYCRVTDDAMLIYGYTEEKDMVAIKLTVDQIVAAEIDPWRIDL